MKTEFKINFIEDYRNCNLITFVDLTEYNNITTIKTPVVSIKVPNFDQIVEAVYTPKYLNTIDIKCHGDGLYIVELSICPNDRLKKSFKFYQICGAVSKIKAILCSDNKEPLMKIYSSLLAAKMMAESDDVEGEKKADIIYRDAIKQINRENG